MQGYTKITVKWVLFHYLLVNSIFVSILFWAHTYFKSNFPTNIFIAFICSTETVIAFLNLWNIKELAILHYCIAKYLIWAAKYFQFNLNSTFISLGTLITSMNNTQRHKHRFTFALLSCLNDVIWLLHRISKLSLSFLLFYLVKSNQN